MATVTPTCWYPSTTASGGVAVLIGNTDNTGTFQAEYDVPLANGNATYLNPTGISRG